MSLKVHAVAKLVTQPSNSYYSQKLETYFRAAGYTDYTIEHDMPFNGPKAKVPWVVFPSGERLADSYFILRHLLANGTIRDVDSSLSPAQRADARAWVVQVDELIYPVTLCMRFLDDAHFAELSGQLFDSIPWFVRPLALWRIRAAAKANLWGHGVARHTDEEREMILMEFFENVERRLSVDGASRCLFREEPCSADVALYAWCVNCLVTKGNPFVKEHILASERLRKYVTALTERWFPEYEEILAMVA